MRSIMKSEKSFIFSFHRTLMLEFCTENAKTIHRGQIRGTETVLIRENKAVDDHRAGLCLGKSPTSQIKELLLTDPRHVNPY